MGGGELPSAGIGNKYWGGDGEVNWGGNGGGVRNTGGLSSVYIWGGGRGGN